MSDKPEWQSSTLNAFDDPDHCQVCAFLAGSRTESDMLEVIRILDSALAAAETSERALMRVVARQSRKIAHGCTDFSCPECDRN